MADDTSTQPQQPTQEPNPALHALERLIGRWNVFGLSNMGQVRFEWMEGGAWLMQHIDLEQDGQRTTGIEMIGYDAESQTLKSHYFSGTGEILEYTWNLSDDTLTIWFGGTDSPAKYVGTFSADGNTVVGAWEWPGGGYESNMSRVE